MSTHTGPVRAALLAGLLAAGVLLAGCTTATEGAAQGGAQSSPSSNSGNSGDSGNSGNSASGSGSSTGGPAQCQFQSTPDNPAPAGKSVGTPASSAPRAGTANADLHTSAGDIALSLNRAEAPCTVASFEYLAGKKYFDNSPCHRLTTYPTLKVLQCGDPTGTGTGGPGYTIPDELPTSLKPAGDGQSDVYPAGTVAMANTGQPHTGGSQFFLVYGDSDLPPQYTVFGTISTSSMATLTAIAGKGVQPGSGQSDQDGTPATPVKISTVTSS